MSAELKDSGKRVLLFIADDHNGGYVSEILAVPHGTNARALIKIFVDDLCVNECSAPATTKDGAAFTISGPLRLRKGQRLYCGLTHPVSAGFWI